MRKIYFSVKGAALIALALLFSTLFYQNGYGQTSRTFTTSGTFNVPAGVTNVTVQAWGGGGAGGGTSASSNRAGGGGSGGTFTKNISVNVTPGATINVIIGLGGLGVNGGDGGAGGSSTFASAIPVTAVGGGGGKVGNGSNNNGAGGGISNGVDFDGGIGAAANGGNSGGGGGGAGNGPIGNGGNASGATGGTGGLGGIPGGAGASGITSGSSNGNSATTLSGGGGGGRNNNSSSSSRSGGAGYRGQIIITYTCPIYGISTAPVAETPICTPTGTSLITLSGSATDLPIGDYTVTYNRSSPAATGLTAAMSVTTAGTGTFTAIGLTTVGNATITVTKLESGVLPVICSTTISSNNVSNTVVVNAAASISTQPVGTQNICVGGNVSFSVAASGTAPITYQWKKGGIDIGGATSSSYSISSVTAGDAGVYTVEIANSCNTLTSGNANLIVGTPAIITANPVSQIRCVGGSVTFSVTATGGPFTYQWRKNGSNISGATSLTYTIGSPVAADAGNYDVVVSVASCGSVTSSVASLTVNTPTAISTQPTATQTICVGGSATFSVAATGTAPISYQWKKGGVNIAGATSSSYSIPSLVSGDAGTYTVAISNSCNAITSNNAVLTVNTPATITANPVSQIRCVGGSVTFSVTATGGPLTYQWRKNGSNISGATSSSYTIGSPLVSDAGSYDVVVSVASCGSVNSSTALLTVNATPTASAGGSQTVCPNETATVSGATASNGTIAWTENGAGSITLGANTLTPVYTPALGDAGNTVTLTMTVSNSPCAAATATYTVQVKSIPTGTFAVSASTICLGETVTFTAPAGYDVYEFFINGLSKQGLSASNIFNTTALTGGEVVTVEAFVNGCLNTMTAPAVTVNPLPTVTLSSNKTTICAGENVTFTAVPGGAVTYYTFRVGTTTVYSGTLATYSSITLTNGASVTVEVTNGNGCKKTSSPVVITVNAVPTGTLAASATAFCAGTNVTFTATAGYSFYEFKIGTTTVQGPVASNTYSNSALTNGQVVSVIATNAATCSTTFNTIAVTVNALPAGTLTATETSGTANDNIVCAGASVTFTASTNAAYTNYNFKVLGVSKQSGALNTFTTSLLANNDIVTVEVTGAGGCIATYTQSQTITVVALPTGSLTTPATTICFGDNAVFTATAGFTNYNFRVDGVTKQNGSANVFSTTALTNGQVVTVIVTGSNGCLSTFSSGPITVNALPTGSLTATETSGNASNDNIICTGATVTFTAPVGFTNYRFLLNGSQVQNGAANTYINASLISTDAVSVEVTNGSNCKATFNAPPILVNPLPSVSAITGTATVCVASTNTTLANAAPGGVWSSSNTAIATVNASTGAVTGVLAGTVTITYTVTNGIGCSDKSDISFIVKPLPVISPISGPAAICVGTTPTYSTVPSTPGGIWSTSNTAIATVGGINGKMTGVSAGPVTLIYAITSNGCTSTSTYAVTVNPLPVLAPISGVLTICANGTTTLSNSTTGGVWTSNNKPAATVDPVTGVVTGVAALIPPPTIIYTYTNGNGCISAVSTIVTVNPIPVPTITGKNPICVGDVETYTTQPGQSAYVWNVVGGTTVGGGPGDNTIGVTWTSTSTKTINVNYSNSFGCTASTSSSFSNAPTTPPPTFTAGPTAACVNSTGNVYSTQAGKTDYTWTVNGGAITAGDGTESIQVTWNTVGARSVSVNYSDIGGCNAANATVRNVTVNPLPTAIISASAVAVCQNVTAPTVTFSGANGLSPYTFTYTITTNGVLGAPQTVTSVGNTASVSVSIFSPGTTYIYSLVSVQDSRSCANPQTGSVTVTVNPLPVVVTNNLAVCSPLTANLTLASVTAGSSASITSYAYYTNAGATNVYPTPAAATAGTYFIKGTTAAGCSAVKDVLVTVNPLPTATVSGTASVCINGTSPVVTFTGAAGTAPYTFTYNINGGANTTVTTTSGNAVTVAAPTGSSGAFIYNLVSVQDASSTTCSQSQSGSATITVNPLSVGGSVSGTTTVCSGSNGATINLTGNIGSVIRWESSIDGGINWVPISNTTSALTYTNITQTTRYRAVVQSGACTSVNSAAAIITVNAVSVGGAVTGSATVCSGTNSGTVTLSGQTGSVVRWESSINGGVNWGIISNTTTSNPYTNITQTTLYRAVVQNGVCGTANSTPVTITVNPLPTATIGGSTNVCLGATSPNVTFTGAVGIAPYTFTYNINGGANQTITTVSGNSITLAAPTTTAGTFSYNLVSVRDASVATCLQAQTGTATITINALPVSPTITPVSAVVCQDDIQPLSAGIAPGSSSVTFASGTLNVSIPDDNTNGIISSIPVSAIPAGAVITGVSVNFNISHTSDNHLRINLKAPNNNILNLVDREGGTGNNFTNTTITSATATSIVGQGAPFTGTYRPEAGNNVSAGSLLGGNSNVNSFAGLYGTPNGNWVFGVRDGTGGTTGTLNNWSITINYSTPAVAQQVTWSPVTDLYTDAGATTAYSGQLVTTVYAKPATSGNKVYTATLTNGSGCVNTTNVAITVNPVPVVSIIADYCLIPGKVRLVASSIPAGASFVWSTGQTGASIDVDIADIYDVVATLPTTLCTGTASVSVAQELVVNGDFTVGITGFTSDYNYKVDQPGLVPAGQGELYDDSGNNGYSITTDGQNLHTNFWGQDHTGNTTGTRNFMAVNGHGTLVAWKSTVDVLPNTVYYFSAWGISLNNAGPFAKLQFNVNGSQVGTVANLTAGVNSNSNNGWTRFYGNWTSGPATTTAVISITDLENALGGNDFGIDDISFGTLSTFITLSNTSGSDAQTPCINTAIVPIVYNVGSSSAPIVTGLPAGVTSSFNGVNLTISGTPTVAGNSGYTVTTTGSCNPTTATGTINVKAQKIDLTTGNSSQTACKNGAIAIFAYTISGEATNAIVNGLPAGVTMSKVGSVFTISGTAATAGIYNYTITTSGSGCATVAATGTITIQEQTITHITGNTTPAVCINSSLPVNIQYSIGGTGTGATVTGLPAGTTGVYNNGSFIISGTPTQAGTFNYTVTTTGSCNLATASLGGTITVNPAASILLTSGNANQAPCINVAISAINFTVGGGGTNATVTGLPTGVTGTFNAGVFTISGTPTQTGVFNYIVSTSGTCAQSQASGTITVLTQKIDLTNGATFQTLCINGSITPIVFTISGSATGVSITGLPAGVSGSLIGNTYTISGSPTVGGTFNYTITTSGSCSPVATATGSFTVQSQTITLTSGSANQTPCINLPITNIVYAISGGATGAGVSGLPAGITGVYNNGVFTISGTTAASGTFNFTITTTGPCVAATATGTLVTGSNIWTGANGTNWSDVNNWSCGVVPVSVTNVVIPTGAINMPQLTSTSVSKSIELQTNTYLDLNGQSFTAYGSVSGAGNFKGSISSNLSIDATNVVSTIVFDQSVDGSTNAVKNLTISGIGNAVTLSNKTAIYGTLLPVAGTLNLNAELVLRSDAAGTARVGEVTGTIAYTTTGKVTVERFYPMSRSWRLVTSPLSNTGSIFNSWQAGAPTNYVPGKGMFVTGPGPSGANGLDVSFYNNYSMKGWNSTTSAYTNVGNTITKNLSNNYTAPGIASNIGYYTFVRGDRRRSPDNTIFGNMNNTTLSSTGYLQTGPQSFNFTGVSITTNPTNPSFELIGNPYASSVNFNTLSKTNVYPHRFFVYDPSLGTVGLFVTMEDFGSPGTFTNQLGSTQGNYIQSSQAFFVQVDVTGPATLTFNETDKSSDYNASLFRPVRPTANMQSLRVTLLQANADNSTLLVDGTLAQFDEQFEDKVDMQDALKFTNITENLSLLRHKQYLAVERRPLIKNTDTLFLQLSRTTQRSYRFAIEPNNIDPTVTAFLEDSYTKLSTPLNVMAASSFDFAITADPKSSVINRFRIVFKQAALGPLPVTFKTIKANEQSGKIAVNWTVENELNIKHYEVEKSADGVSFTKANTTVATGANRISSDYNWLDVNPLSGNNFYRVRSIGLDGGFDYSSTVLVKMAKMASGIRIYPNPVTDIIGAEFKNMSAGIYTARLVNALGQTVLVKTINHTLGTSMENITPDYKLLSGIYQLEITAPDKEITTVKVIVK